MCETWYDCDPYLVCTDWKMWICSNEEVVEQAHISHGLLTVSSYQTARGRAEHSRTCLASIASCLLLVDAEMEVTAALTE
jgi:hypothetical protein